MVCANCGTVFEGRFCIACGMDTQAYAQPYVPPFMYRCVQCGAPFTGAACPWCGTPVGGQPRGGGVRMVGSVAWSIGLVLFLVLLAVNLAALAYASGLIIQGSAADGPRFIDLYVLLPYPEGFAYDAPPGVFLAYFILILTAIVAAHAYYIVRDGKVTVRAMTRPLADLRGRLQSKSAFVATGQVFLAVFFFQFFWILLVAATGTDPRPPALPGNIPPWYQYYALANASVYEEIVTRWMFIGLPLAAGAILFRENERAAAASEGRTPVAWWRHLFGGTVTRHSPAPVLALAAMLVLLSATIFGLAHVPAWGWWKFFPTFVAGLGMGYLFLRSGLFAAVLFHFATNYLAAAALLTADNLGAQALLLPFIIGLLGLGLLFFAWYFVYATELIGPFAASVGLRRPQPVSVAAAAPPFPTYAPPAFYVPPPPPSYPYPMPAPPVATQPAPPVPPYGRGFVPFACARCGWREARYADGRFTCLRCGHVAP